MQQPEISIHPLIGRLQYAAKITATMRSDLPVKHGWKGADQFIIVKGTWVEKLMAE